MLRIGLNPYGLSYTVLGWPGQGTPRANPRPWGLWPYLDLCAELNARVVEVPTTLLEALDGAGWERLRARLHELNAKVVLSQGSPVQGFERSFELAPKAGAAVVRMSLTSVLAGARAALGPRWERTLAEVRAALREAAPRAADAGLALGLENHQDLTSAELMDLCAPFGPHVGVCLDTGNPLAVGEDPVEFARAVGPRVRHVHLKDYRVQWTAEGYRLIRCASGSGAIPFTEVIRELLRFQDELTAVLEPGALEVRHVRLLMPDWWNGYAPRTARDLAAGLAAARKGLLPEDADYRTPWEAGAGPEAIVAFELEQMRESARLLGNLGETAK
ncbi:MAG: sugar phosphate isomerase/epimerase [Planctomycetota bacterium]|nr:sugar phosphate isomerase/epimerase [Planctomycetota bacterium]